VVRSPLHAALAAIIIMSVVNMIDFARSTGTGSSITTTPPHLSHARQRAAVRRRNRAAGRRAGGVALFVRRSSKPHLAVVGRVGDSAHFRSLQRHDVTTYPRVTAVRIDENLYFANTNDVENRLYRVLQRQPETRHLLLVCSAINFIDTSGLDMLLRLNRNLERRDIRLHLAELKAPVMDQLRATELPEVLTGEIFFTTDQAMKDLSQRA
jgi:SulP family sulfate permease